MQASRIHDLLRLGPNEQIIFLRDVSAADTIAPLIAGLANTRGGTIVFGVKNRKAITGLANAHADLAKVAQAAEQIRPPILLESQIITVDDKDLLLIDVPQGYDTPYTTSDGRILVRNRTRTIPAGNEQAAELARRAVQGAALVSLGAATQRMQPKSVTATVDLDHIMLKLERLIIANAELTHKLEEANSWRNRVTDQVIGAILGLVISLTVFYLLGLG